MSITSKLFPAVIAAAICISILGCGDSSTPAPKPKTATVVEPVVMTQANVRKNTFHIITKGMPAPVAGVIEREVRNQLNSGLKKNWEVVQTAASFPAGVSVDGVIALGTADNIPAITTTPKPPVVVINPTGTVAADLLVVTDGGAADTKDLTPELLADIVSGKVASASVHDYAKLGKAAATQAKSFIAEGKPEASLKVPVLTVTKENAESADVKALLP